MSSEIQRITELLAEKTKTKAVIWLRLDDRRNLTAMIQKQLHEQRLLPVSPKQCFACEIQGGYFALLAIKGVGKPSEIVLMVIPTLPAREYPIYSDDTSLLIELYQIVEGQFLSVEGFLDSSLKFLESL